MDQHHHQEGVAQSAEPGTGMNLFTFWSDLNYKIFKNLIPFRLLACQRVDIDLSPSHGQTVKLGKRFKLQILKPCVQDKLLFLKSQKDL